MPGFIAKVINTLNAASVNYEDTLFILPTKRAAVFLKKELSKTLSTPIIAPDIFSIEEFVEQISGIRVIGNTELLFEFYSIYCDQTPEDKQERFESFLSWAPTVLQDFNEIDRFLVEPEQIFGYLKAIKDIEHWSLSEEPTALMTNYLDFWNRLHNYYQSLNEHLLNQDTGYQGMAFRSAVDQLEPYISNSENKLHVFMGFNALNKAESFIIQELLGNGLAKIFWDMDAAFHDHQEHSAGLYTRLFHSRWSFYKQHPFNWVDQSYSQEKNIEVVGIPKPVGQAKYVGHLLNSIENDPAQLSQTAVILGDESLLLPLLMSIPEDIAAVNITMGLPLKYIPLANLFDFLFRLHKNQSGSFYYRDVVNILSHNSVAYLLDTQAVLGAIHSQNKVYMTLDWLMEQLPEATVLRLLFGNWHHNPAKALESCHELISQLKEAYQAGPEPNTLALEYLFRFHTLINSLIDLHKKFNHFSSIESLYQIYQELLRSETLDFKGEPLQGLQIMGMLESRVLDFETIIITSVNEGILPAGKSQNTMIPFEVKLEHGLPTYKEKDAVYTYHFYRLLQRAKKVYLLYDTEIDTLYGGEKSRFINQLEVEGIHNIRHKIVSPKVAVDNKELKTIEKNSEIYARILSLGASGFSPSALTKYVRNPIDYYYDYILSIKELDAVEEHIAANTLGSILHEGLEELYTPFLGKTLELRDLETALKGIPEIIEKAFIKHYGRGNFDAGKNLIAFEVAKRYLYNFIALEKNELKQGHRIRIMALEHKAQVPISIPQLDEPIHLKGTVDRIDEYDGILRIIDYKSGRVNAGDVAIYDWEDLVNDYGKSKAFQLLCYTYIYWKSEGVLPEQAGIISFKNLKSGVLNFGVRSSPRGKIDPVLSSEIMLKFEALAAKLILELLDVNTPFIEKEVL